MNMESGELTNKQCISSTVKRWRLNVARFMAVLLLGLLFSGELLAVPKQLYLWTNTIERLVPGGLGPVNVSGGTTYDWVLNPALQTDLTVDGSSGVIPVTLVLSKTGQGDLRSYTISLSSSAIGTFATLSLTDIDLNPAITATYNLIPTSPGDQVLPAGSTITLSIVNNTAGNRRIRVSPSGSFVNLPSNTVVNVDSVQFYDAAYPGGSPVTGAAPGSTVYVRSVVSDPFGSFDITSATIDILDPTATPVISGAAMTEVADSGVATKTYEYTYTIPAAGPDGIWTAQVTANEGFEGTVSHTNSATISVSGPILTILKSVSALSDPFNGAVNPKAIPGAQMLYNIQVINTGNGSTDTDTVIINDPIPTNTALQVTGTPVIFIDSSPASGLTYTFTALNDLADDLEFSVDGADWTYSPTADANGVDVNVRYVRINPTGALAGNTTGSDPNFQLRFIVIVQ